MKILTFDVEDWFHILDNPSTRGINEWSKFESRLDRNMDLILSLLDENNQKATFFCVGWVAEKHPNQIRRITEAGHEIGSHTFFHELVFENSKENFEIDLVKSLDILESISGKKVNSFRAPGFSITSKTPWAFETLLRNGIEIDSSVFPAQRSHGGFSEIGITKPFLIESHGMRLKEFPINIYPILKQNIVFSGGGYFRLLPYELIKHFTKKSDYVMSYFHPRDFDATQPMVPGLSLSRKFKSYYGLKNTEQKLNNWLEDFSFTDLREADEKVNWDNALCLKVS